VIIPYMALNFGLYNREVCLLRGTGSVFKNK